MIKNPFPDEISSGEKYVPAMSITTQADAEEYLARCVDHNMRVTGNSRDTALTVEQSNIGYVAGYYGEDVRLRVERLFGATHPVFGSIAKDKFMDVIDTQEVQFRPGSLEAVADLLGDAGNTYLSATNPYTVTTEMRNLLANADDPLALKLRPYFVIDPQQPINTNTPAEEESAA